MSMKVFTKCVMYDEFSCFMLDWNLRNYAPQLSPLYGRVLSVVDDASRAEINTLLRTAIQNNWPRGSREAIAKFFRTTLEGVKKHGQAD